jgi:hypothetical protein
VYEYDNNSNSTVRQTDNTLGKDKVSPMILRTIKRRRSEASLN